MFLASQIIPQKLELNRAMGSIVPMNLELVRFAYTAQSTLGWLHVADLDPIAVLEEAWIESHAGPGGQRRERGLPESCVPDGEYRLLPHTGAKFTDVFVLVNPDLGVYRYPDDIPRGQTWGRSAILIHQGNSLADSSGCLLVGLRHGAEAGKPFVYESRRALDALRTVLGSDEHQLLIRPSMGTAEEW